MVPLLTSKNPPQASVETRYEVRSVRKRESARLTLAVFPVRMQLEADLAGTFVPTERIDAIVLATVIRQLALVEFLNVSSV